MGSISGLSDTLPVARRALVGLVLLFVVVEIFFFFEEGEDVPQIQGHMIRWNHELPQSRVPSDLEMIPIQVGRFEMGLSGFPSYRFFSSYPGHRVTLTRDFEMSKTEVTRQQWAAVIGASDDLVSCPQCPIEGITWYEALIFTNALSRMAGLTPCYEPSDALLDEEERQDPLAMHGVRAKEDPGLFGWMAHASRGAGGVDWIEGCDGFRLPTEAEWEYAALAGGSSHFMAGDPKSWDCADDPVSAPFSWYCGNSGGTSKPVGTKQPNSWGLYDVHGNVSEWVWDGYERYSPRSVSDPRGDSLAGKRVTRGGSYAASIHGCSVRYRRKKQPDLEGGLEWRGNPRDGQGLRIARTLP